jgi:hypothetical protein
MSEEKSRDTTGIEVFLLNPSYRAETQGSAERGLGNTAVNFYSNLNAKLLLNGRFPK